MNFLKREWVQLVLTVIFSTLLLWWPFFGDFETFLTFEIPPEGMQAVFANYDGPNYLAIAKTWYEKGKLAHRFALPVPPEYYPAHFPGYPLTIGLMDWFFSGPWAMLTATLAASVGAALIFWKLIKENRWGENAWWLTVVFLFLPARFLVVRTVGSAEPLFTGAILASFYFFRKEKFWMAGICGALAQLTKTPGILLAVSYAVFFIWQIINDPAIRQKWAQEAKKRLPLTLIPLAVLAVFGFYQWQTGDFWAYFHSGDNFHLTPIPFQAFNSSRTWLDGIWNEDMVWTYLISLVGIILLFKRKLIDLGIFAGIFWLATVFVAHRDIARYSLPMWPMVIIGLAPWLEKKEFKIAFWLVLPAIYFYALNFISGNLTPIVDWTPYL